jgi:ribosomal protein S18 acetylase RimI-like enzyme
MPHDAKTLREVAELHALCIDQGFLSSLGPRILTVLYRAIDRSDAAVLIVEQDGTGVTGLVSGGCGMGPIYRQMLRDLPALMCALAPLLFKPRVMWGIIEILRRGEAQDPGSTLPPHELFSIAVAPSARGDGTADRLYHALCRRFEDDGASAFRIVVGDTLTRARRFYARLGAEPVATIRLHGTSSSTVFVQRLGNNTG